LYRLESHSVKWIFTESVKILPIWTKDPGGRPVLPDTLFPLLPCSGLELNLFFSRGFMIPKLQLFKIMIYFSNNHLPYLQNKRNHQTGLQKNLHLNPLQNLPDHLQVRQASDRLFHQSRPGRPYHNHLQIH